MNFVYVVKFDLCGRISFTEPMSAQEAVRVVCTNPDTTGDLPGVVSAVGGRSPTRSPGKISVTRISIT